MREKNFYSSIYPAEMAFQTMLEDLRGDLNHYMNSRNQRQPFYFNTKLTHQRVQLARHLNERTDHWLDQLTSRSRSSLADSYRRGFTPAWRSIREAYINNDELTKTLGRPPEALFNNGDLSKILQHYWELLESISARLFQDVSTEQQNESPRNHLPLAVARFFK